MIWQKEIIIPQVSRGIHSITNNIINNIDSFPSVGMLNIFLKHTSAGIIINENADPSVLSDFESFLSRFIPEDRNFTHTMEGLDDMPAHIKSSILGQSLTIPISNGKLNLGIWQGIYLYEFRHQGGSRKLVLTIYS